MQLGKKGYLYAALLGVGLLIVSYNQHHPEEGMIVFIAMVALMLAMLYVKLKG